MSLPLLILVTGFLYILMMGGMSLLRREGLSTQVPLEAIFITLIVSGLTYWREFLIHPVVFLVVLYLITMRVRLLVDIGNYFAQRGNLILADRCYRLGLHLWPDPSSRLATLVNQGTFFLQRGELDRAIQMLKSVLEKKSEGFLGTKYEAAAHYNLGVAYLRKNLDAQARVEFNAVIDIWPASEYARRAENALTRKR
jgi:tetratricopeptide (TPR) repeat protein